MTEKSSIKTITEPQGEIEVRREVDVPVVGDLPGEIASAHATARNFAEAKKTSTKTITEPQREIEVCREVDVVVVGGGPGGIASALAAARNGADTILVERYGHLGGMATGGLVTIIPNLSNINGEQQIAGICQELIDRLDTREATHYPRKEDWGSSEESLVDFYVNANQFIFYIRDDLNTGKKRVLYTALIDPEILKCELNTMMEEAGVTLYCHSWGTLPIVEGDKVKGVIIESKSGRQAITAKVVIDSTGDGDLLLPAGAECDTKLFPKTRIGALAFPFWIGNIDLKKYDEYKASNPDKHNEIIKELADRGGAPYFLRDLVKYHDGVIWFHPMFSCLDQSDVTELNRVELAGRKQMLITYEYFRDYMPGFENCYIALSSPQLGTQGGKRVIGEYYMTEKDMVSDEIFEDTIAVFANNDTREISAKHPNICIPYRSLVPKKIDGLLVACRAFSSDHRIQEYFNLIPHCIAFGQAAGTAAAMAIEEGIQPRNVDYLGLKQNLVKQGVIIPGM